MEKQEKLITPRIIALLLIAIVIMPMLPLIISWRWDWWEAWVYVLMSILGFAVSRILAARRNPDLIKERAHYLDHKDTAAWDTKLSPVVGLGGVLLVLVAGLDERFDWSPAFSLGLKIACLVVLLASYVFSSYAFIENRYFSGTVRIQAERDHHVIDSGPYAWVRHPGYAGAILNYLATPFLLDSAWAFLPALAITILMVVRTRLEDRYLQENLTGYRAYAGKVRYRLFPGLW
jgi:protein-S-isoprenylcysteine O-methyltransferase Ste14